MKILTLIIKTSFLNEILAGTKKLETRDIRPASFKKYYDLDQDGQATGLKHYDAIQFYAGYRTDRKSALVEIKSSEMFVLSDEDTDEDITYVHNDIEYVATIAEYQLGKVLSTNN